MILLGGQTSPYVRVVRLQIELCKLHDQVTLEMVPTRVPDSPVHKHNPTGKIPTLVVDDDHAIAEARLICEYLDKFHDGPKFAPVERSLAESAFEGKAIGFIDGVAVYIREARRPVDEQSPGIIEQEQARARRCMAWMTAEMDTLSAPLDYARSCIAVALWRLRYSLPDFDWAAEFPAVHTWLEQVEAMPEFPRTAPE
ncbi:MAG: glutathione S-transferase family protein [Pseudomonadota bacterium]